MDPFLTKIKKIKNIDDALHELESQIKISDKLKSVINFSIEAHKGQFRKSGEPYIVHPILVATLTAYFSKEEDIVAAALLHDVVEDTHYDLDFVHNEWGSEVAHIVDGLTKIVEIKESKLNNQNEADKKLLNSALTFRKMLIASIDDVRVLVVKLCDRLHNMLTLEALPIEKQKRIAEETLVVYVPISHRLGISSIKNALEDLAFFYIYPEEYEKIDTFIKEHQHKIQLTFNQFISNTKVLLEKNGFDLNKVKIFSRIKHYYSIYMKMQRKGVNIDEVLDLLAIRILVENEMDCYRVLGFMHLDYKPLIARFKDYVATPKENGYQTIHTTVFYNSKIYEIQIRTFDMHKIAEYGVAAHWMYKSGTIGQKPNLNWLKSLEFSNKNVEEFYHEAKQDLFSEDIVVYSPQGDTFTLPRGATAYDFGFAVHSDVGNNAIESYVNKVKKPLLTELKSSDIVSIRTASFAIPRCSWFDMVKTSKAKKHIKILCSHRQKEINELSGKNILDTMFSRYTNHITDIFPQKSLHKVPLVLDLLKNKKKQLEKLILKRQGIVARFKVINRKIKLYKFDNILVYSNFSISQVAFDHCCHPKFGDEIVAFKANNVATIHHQMCDKAYSSIKTRHQMLFCEWVKNTLYHYKMVVSLPSTRGELAKLLSYMAQYEIYILSIEYGREKHSYIQYCDIEFEINNGQFDKVKKLIERKVKVIDFFFKKDAYNK